jgi:hypothetical protein
MPTALAPAPARAANGKGGDKVIPARPFRIGAQPIDDEAYDVTVQLGAGPVTLTPQYEIPSTGYLNTVYILVEATGGVNGAAVIAFAEDGPESVIGNLQFTDTNNAEIISPITGWDLKIIDKYGGYAFSDDPRSSPVYSAPVGAGAEGDFTFILRLPVELVPRDALGSLPNKSSSTPFKVKTQIAASTDVYTTAPDTTLPVVRVRMTPISYWEPTATDGSGNPVAPNPPGVMTTQYWNRTDYVVNSGAITPQLTSSTGFPIRNILFVLRADGVRATGETDFPDPFKVQIQSNMIVDRIKLIWQHMIAQDYGYTAAVADAAGAKEPGVYALPFCKDFGPKPGWENRRGYLRTSDGMRLKVIGTVGGAGAHTLSVLTNYVGIGAGATLGQLTT